jgi:hypothetical protein
MGWRDKRIVAFIIAFFIAVSFKSSRSNLEGIKRRSEQLLQLSNSPAIQEDDIQQAKLKSSVEYRACCGLGHRMNKLADAHYIAHKRNIGLRVFFGFCNETTEVFHHFFGAQPLSELANVTDLGRTLKINNEVPCFNRFKRTGNASECKCPTEYIEQTERFYSSLMKRFEGRQEIQNFKKRNHFDNHTVIGLHIRAGNGETGDFVEKNRGIRNSTAWIRSMTSMILNISRDWTEEPPLLFIATDTASMVQDFRHELSGKIKVLDYHQERVTSGGGVVFGEHGSRKSPTGDQCINNWKNIFMDMMLLASTDFLIAGRPSSFTQSLPMSVVLGRHSENGEHRYCEVAPNASQYHCFSDYQDWCCRGSTKFHLQGIKPHEFRNIPIANFDMRCSTDERIHVRPEREDESVASFKNNRVSTFLPYDWDWVNSDNVRA